MRHAIAFMTGLFLAGAAAAAQDAPPPPGGAGPRGTSGEVRDDAVGTATLLRVAPGAAPVVRVAVLHRTLPKGAFVEITALDSGRTIVAVVVGPYRGRGLVGLSPAAAQSLGVTDGAGVRVRAATPNEQDQVALRSGNIAGARMDAPPALLLALRRQIHTDAPARTERAASVRTARALATRDFGSRAQFAVRPVRTRTQVACLGVQVAALRSAGRAAVLARAVGGHVATGGGLYRVRLGPFADTAAAAHARDAMMRQGYRDARIFPSD